MLEVVLPSSAPAANPPLSNRPNVPLLTFGRAPFPKYNVPTPRRGRGATAAVFRAASGARESGSLLFRRNPGPGSHVVSINNVSAERNPTSRLGFHGANRPEVAQIPRRRCVRVPASVLLEKAGNLFLTHILKSAIFEGCGGRISRLSTGSGHPAAGRIRALFLRILCKLEKISGFP